jgi:DUF1680 family protein
MDGAKSSPLPPVPPVPRGLPVRVCPHPHRPATLTWPATGAVIVQEADYPVSTTFTTRLTVQTPGHGTGAFSLLLRVPAWATTGGNTVTLNGVAVPGVTPGQYLNVTRVWAAGDVLQVGVGACRGAVVLCAQSRAEEVRWALLVVGVPVCAVYV